MPKTKAPRRHFFSFAGAAAAALGARFSSAAPTPAAPASTLELPSYARDAHYKTARQSSFDRTGGNKDFFSIASGETKEVFQAAGPGIVTHIWFTIAAQSPGHLKELVLRIYWDGASQPAVETPVGDFFGLNLGDYFVYQSAFLNCSSIKGLNCYFAMPFRRSARITVTNEGGKSVGSFYSNIDYQLVPALPSEALYFHAQYRQAVPNPADASGSDKNLSGLSNYVFLDTVGRGHLMGVTLGVVQNKPGWFGEGDDMTAIDNPTAPAITGTGTEDYFCGAWNFGGVNGAVPFAHLYNGAPYVALPEHTGGRYCLYRWHADNPIAFDGSLKHTIEHGHANDRADCYYSVAYWYASEAASPHPPLPPWQERIPQVKLS